jgi:exo-1,4-beta-D-glucosaminidase
MLNNAWPSMIWHLYDYYLRPAGGYFGTKKACEPLHVQYSYDDRSIAVVNDLHEPFSKLKVSAEVYDLNLMSKFSREATVDVAADGVVRALTIPSIPGLTKTYFLRLRLDDEKGQTRSTNFYWLSTQEDVLDWKNTKWYYTPTSRHSDLTALAKLPPTTLDASLVVSEDSPENNGRATIANTGKALAFQVRLKAVDPSNGEEILPVFWEDNYFELFPGEQRAVRVAWQRGGVSPRLEVEAWNAKLAKPGSER